MKSLGAELLGTVIYLASVLMEYFHLAGNVLGNHARRLIRWP